MIAEPGAVAPATVIGVRGWRVLHGRLYALTGEPALEWLPGATVDARCDDPGGRVPHQAPALGCECGAYAVDSVNTLERALHRMKGVPRRGVVIGAVQLWGAPGRPVIVGELRVRRGQPPGLQYRAPHMRIVALASSPLADRVGPSLGLAVVAREHLELIARERGGVQLRPPAQPGPSAREQAAVVDVTDLVDLARWVWAALGWSLRHVATPVVADFAWPLLRWALGRWWMWAAFSLLLATQPVSAFEVPAHVTPLVLVQLLVHAAVQWLRVVLPLATVVAGVVLAVRNRMARAGLWRAAR